MAFLEEPVEIIPLNLSNTPNPAGNDLSPL